MCKQFRRVPDNYDFSKTTIHDFKTRKLTLFEHCIVVEHLKKALDVSEKCLRKKIWPKVYPLLDSTTYALAPFFPNPLKSVPRKRFVCVRGNNFAMEKSALKTVLWASFFAGLKTAAFGPIKI